MVLLQMRRRLLPLSQADDVLNRVREENDLGSLTTMGASIDRQQVLMRTHANQGLIKIEQ
jgi:hypothetical protein